MGPVSYSVGGQVFRNAGVLDPKARMSLTRGVRRMLHARKQRGVSGVHVVVLQIVQSGAVAICFSYVPLTSCKPKPSKSAGRLAGRGDIEGYRRGGLLNSLFSLSSLEKAQKQELI